MSHSRTALTGRSPDSTAEWADRLRDVLVCPACFGELDWSTTRIDCAACGMSYPVEDGIPILLPDPASIDVSANGGEPNPDAEQIYKRRQAEFFDAENAEFEITRPHGTPRLYRWLLAEKLRRSLAGLGASVDGMSVLTVCGGSGMDAEFLARRGAQVITSDISLGAARRARERGRRYGVVITPIVADAERLPFRDWSIDLVFVHDGLHHLADPSKGLAEMARVAARAVSITEPARASITALAVRLGLAQEQEAAGNRIGRLSLDGITDDLRHRGFDVVRAERYGMYYRHEPGSIFATLSLPVVFPLCCLTWRAVNSLIGRFGNKLTVQATRAGQPRQTAD